MFTLSTRNNQEMKVSSRKPKQFKTETLETFAHSKQLRWLAADKKHRHKIGKRKNIGYCHSFNSPIGKYCRSNTIHRNTKINAHFTPFMSIFARRIKKLISWANVRQKTTINFTFFSVNFSLFFTQGILKYCPSLQHFLCWFLELYSWHKR